MSLSDSTMLATLKSKFICGVRDITGESWAGRSGVHAPSGQAFLADNGAGPHNLQILILSSDGVVLHCLPGYWNPHDLAGEIQLAERINKVWRSSLSRAEKDRRFRELQLAHIQEHSPDMVRRSRMQKFDMQYESRKRPTTSDTLLHPVTPGEKPPASAFKTTDRIMHERMALRPFVKYEEFDIEKFTDYGRPKYDKNEDQRTPGPDKTLAARKSGGHRQP